MIKSDSSVLGACLRYPSVVVISRSYSRENGLLGKTSSSIVLIGTWSVEHWRWQVASHKRAAGFWYEWAAALATVCPLPASIQRLKSTPRTSKLTGLFASTKRHTVLVSVLPSSQLTSLRDEV